jgi:hypothetical protein
MAQTTPEQQYALQVANGVDPSVASGAGPISSQDPQVFTGKWGGALTGYPGSYGYGVLTGAPGAGQTQVPLLGGGQDDTRAPVLTSFSDATIAFQNGLVSHDPHVMAIRQEMIDAGMIDPNTDLYGVVNAYKQMLSLSADSAAKGQFVSPEQYISAWKSVTQKDAPVTWNSTSTSRTVHNTADLAGAYQSTAEQALGRRATPGEAARAAGAVKASADASPTVTTSRQTTDAKGHTVNSSSVTRQGMGVDAINEQLLQQAMSQPDYAEYQAAGHYFPALLSALGGITNAGA